MQIHIGQIYIEQGAYFPFSHIFQRYISEEVSALVVPSKKFIAKYGNDYKLIFNVSAKHSLTENEIRGPTVFKKTKDVEYTIFLPFSVIMNEPRPPQEALNYIFRGVCAVFDQLGIDATQIRERQEHIVNHVCADSAMFQDVENLKRFNETVSYLDEHVWTGHAS
jgi:hypothetical protein